jgi:hypothetical protein
MLDILVLLEAQSNLVTLAIFALLDLLFPYRVRYARLHNIKVLIAHPLPIRSVLLAPRLTRAYQVVTQWNAPQQQTLDANHAHLFHLMLYTFLQLRQHAGGSVLVHITKMDPNALLVTIH